MPGASFSARDERRLLAIRDILRTLEVGGHGPWRALMPALRELLATEKVVAYGLQQGDAEHHEVAFVHAAGLDQGAFHRTFGDYASRTSVRWCGYNPGCPEPTQRNRIIRFTGKELEEMGQSGVARIATECYPQLGVALSDQMRTLICEGASLLAWVGAWQSVPFDAHQRALLAAVAPDLQRRLCVERQLEHGGRGALLEVALEAIGNAAFIADARGRILHGNSAGMASLLADRAGTRGDLADAVTRRAEHPRWSRTPARTASGQVEYLVVGRALPEDRLKALVGRATARWKLTARQSEVLGHLAEGNANRTIAALLGLAERTVEVHVTALLEKAQVEGRSALVARVYALE